MLSLTMSEETTKLAPWPGDTCSLVDAFRSGERTPVEELETTLRAIESSQLNAFSFIDAERALDQASKADVTRPLGGVPLGIKELDCVEGWPDTGASLPLKDRTANHDAVFVKRLREAGAVLIGLTTASEFGGVNLTCTRLNGATRNPWNLECTPGGSSGGAAAAVAGGLITIGNGGDGGGSIRIPASFTGLPGLKATYGRIPKGPNTMVGSMTAVQGCLSRSVRDIARYFDICKGFDRRDPYSIPDDGHGWEQELGTMELRGRRVAISPDLGVAVVHPEVADLVQEHAKLLVDDAGLEIVDLEIELPDLGSEWVFAGIAGVFADLGERYPDCAAELTPEIAFATRLATDYYDIKRRTIIETRRIVMNEAMAAIFDQVDFVICASCPDVAFDATGPLRTQVADRQVSLANNGALTIPANIYGNPSISIPIGFSRGLPVGMQVMGRHHQEQLLLDLALIVEKERPWPLVAPEAPL